MPIFPVAFDEIDRLLLRELQDDADRPLDKLSELVGLSPSALSRRIKRYKESGVVQATVALLDPEAVGIGVHVLCHITCTDDSAAGLGGLKTALNARAEVVQLYEVAGAIDLIAVFAVRSMQRYVDLTGELLAEDPIVLRFESHVAFDVSQPTARLAV